MSQITNTDIINLKTLMTSSYDFSFRDYHIDNACKLYQEQPNIENLKSLLDGYRIKKLEKIYDYLESDCGLQCYERLDNKMMTARISSEQLDFYVKAVKNNKIDVSDSRKDDIIANFYISNLKDFDNLLKLSLTVKENTIDSFFKVLEKKNGRTLNALQSIEVEKLYQKKFSLQDKEKHLNRLYRILPTLKKESFIEESEGYFYQLDIDTNKISAFNLLDKQANYLKIKVFSEGFIKFISNHQELNIKTVKLEADNSFHSLYHVKFTFDKLDNMEGKKMLIKDILEHCIFSEITPDELSTFISSSILEKKLNKELTHKSSLKTKKI